MDLRPRCGFRQTAHPELPPSDACPVFPGERYEDWKLDDPAGRDLDAVRPVRDEIRDRVQTLLKDLRPA